VNRGVHVVLDDALADEDRVFEVVTLPGHERDEHVLAESEVAHVARGPSASTSPTFMISPGTNDRLLVVASALVRALVLREVVDVRHLVALARGGAHDDALGVDALDDPARLAIDAHAGVDRDASLHARADERRLGAHERHRLALHVRAHERAVRVVVLEERHERGRDAHHLVRRHVHELDLSGIAMR
jgi:hypothetical protein